MGDTPIHVAAKSGNTKILTFFLKNCTPSFKEIKNDFGLTPLEAAILKRELAEVKANASQSFGIQGSGVKSPIESHRADETKDIYTKQDKLD